MDVQKKKQKKNSNPSKLFEFHDNFCFLAAILSLISLKDIFLWFFWNWIFFKQKMVVAYRIRCYFKKCFCFAGGDSSHWTNFYVCQYGSLANSIVSTILFYWLKSVQWTSDGFEIVIEVVLVSELSVYKQIHYIERCGQLSLIVHIQLQI